MSSNSHHDGRVRAIICDADPMARRVVRDALQADRVAVVADVSNGREALELAVHYRPDVVIVDVLMPDLDGLETTRRIVEQAPGVRVLMLTISDDPDLGMSCLRAGAAGFLSKAIDPRELAGHVREVAQGRAALSGELTLKLIERLRALPEGGIGIRPVRSPLTSREWEVLDELCAGATADEIADEFVLSVETVRSHIKSILRKLGVHSQAEAVEVAARLRSPLAARAETV